MFLLYNQQIDTIAFGSFAYFSSFRHVGRVGGAVHAKLVKDLFGFIDQLFSLVKGHKLGQIGFAQFINVVQFAIRKQTGTADAAENIAGLAFDTLLIGLDWAITFLGDLAFIDE
jgi:hypothetical protein